MRTIARRLRILEVSLATHRTSKVVAWPMCSGSDGVGVLHKSEACRMKKCSGSILSSIKLFGVITWAMERLPAPCGTLVGVDSRLRQRLRTTHSL